MLTSFPVKLSLLIRMKTFVTIICFSTLLTAVLSEKTHCQEEREKAINSATLIKLIPECEENGDYKAKQCFPGNKFCQCVRKDGSAITEMSAVIKACECIRARDQANSRHLIGNYKPQCEEDGTYRRTQCWGSVGSCWCVDEFGTKLPHKTIFDDC